MTTLLLDTHAVLWFWWNDPRLSPTAQSLICDPANRKLVSMATPWEVAIKVSGKKLDLGGTYAGFFDQHMIRAYFEWLQIATKHLNVVALLPFHHNDPFDRFAGCPGFVGEHSHCQRRSPPRPIRHHSSLVNQELTAPSRSSLKPGITITPSSVA